MNASSTSDRPANTSFALITQVTIYSFNILLAVAYSVLISTQSALRKNKLNWFTINVCLTSACLSAVMLAINLQQLLKLSRGLPCRSQTFILEMAACLLIYSHCAFAFSRLLTIVYAHKHIFRSNLALWTCIISGWLISCLLSLPYLFMDGLLCPISISAILFPYYSLITTLLLPILIVTVCNARTLLFVRNSTRRVHATGMTGHAVYKRDVFLVKLTIGTFTAFIIGWTPSFTIQLFHLSASIPTILSHCAQILPALALLYDVLLLIFTNQPVRTVLKRGIRRILKCECQ